MLTYAVCAADILLLFIFLVFRASNTLKRHILYEIDQIGAAVKNVTERQPDRQEEIAETLKAILAEIKELRQNSELATIAECSRESEKELVSIGKRLEQIRDAVESYSPEIQRISDHADSCAGSLRSIDDFNQQE